MLADAVSVQGLVSFRIDQCSIPVGEIDQQQRQQLTDIDGTLRLSGVSVGLNNQITANILALLKRFGRVENDMKLTVSRSSEVRFHVIDGRVHHQGLMFLLPIGASDFELKSSGSVGFDETLDLELALGLPDSVLGDGPLGKFLSSDPLVIQVTGGIKEPKIKLASDIGWTGRLQSLLEAIESPNADKLDAQKPDEQNSESAITESAGTVLDIVGGLIDRANERDKPPLSDLRERLREVRDADAATPRRPGLLRRRRQPE